MLKSVTAGVWVFRCGFFSEMLYCCVSHLLVKSWEHGAVWVDSVDLCSVCYETKMYRKDSPSIPPDLSFRFFL